MAAGELMNSVATWELPQPDDPCWRRVLLRENALQFKHLVSQLMLSRVKLILQADASDASLCAAAMLITDFFKKNYVRVPEDFRALVDQLSQEVQS